MEEKSFLDRVNSWAKNSVTLKLLIIGFLILMLLIPSGMVSSLIYERQRLRDGAINEVSQKWGLEQTITGPVLSVPYEVVKKDEEGKPYIADSGYAHYLPDELNISGDVFPEKKNRGIYIVVLYNAKINVSGTFSALDEQSLNLRPDDLMWDKALFTMGITDMKGVRSAINVNINAQAYEMGPGTVTTDIFGSGANTPIDLTTMREQLTFNYELDINGSSSIFFTPFGKETKVNIQSSWSDPSFDGAFLPEHNTSESGFTANWKVLQFNRNYPQKGKNGFIGNPKTFGVKLLVPVDEYAKTNRSAKYASMFIIITFLTFFFMEVLNRKRLHPIQYLLVGAAIILFYVLLLSISEHLNFDYAYWIACGACLTLITFYSYHVLRNTKLTSAVFGILLTLYGFFYSILQLQDYSLLLGSLGLLVILGTIMYLTRNLDWYNLNRRTED